MSRRLRWDGCVNVRALSGRAERDDLLDRRGGLGEAGVAALRDRLVA